MSSIDFHLDRAQWHADPRTPISIHGWCAWREGRTLRRVVARVGDKIRAAAEPFARDDVAAALVRPTARLSGFNLILPFLELTDIVHVLAESTDDHIAELTALRVGDLPGKGTVVLAFEPCPGPENRARTAMTSVSSASSSRLLLSVLVPVYNTPAPVLRECIESVRQQTYADWELCLVDDASDRAETRALLREYQGTDPRIHLDRLAMRGGISRATNRALARASGDFIVPLDHDDRFLPHALATFAGVVANTALPATCDVLYSDEEKITETGDLRQPVLKPGFSPEFLRGVMYVGHAVCVRRTLAVEVGGYDSEYDGIQDFEFFLRLTEKAPVIRHVPEILYQWRLSAESSAQHGNIKGDMDALQVRAVEAHLARLGRRARVRALGNHRVAVERPVDFVRPAITLFISPAAAASPPLRNLHNVRIVPFDATHSAAMHSAAVGELAGCLLEPILEASPDWLDDLAWLALAPDAGRVSPVLRSLEGKVLESGRTLTSDGRSVPLMRGFDPAADGYSGSLRCHREVLLESPACWLASVHRDAVPNVRYQRVCASAWIRLSRSWAVPTGPAETPAIVDVQPARDPFYHHGFDRLHGDYRLVESV